MASIIIPAYKELECLKVLIPEIFKYISTEDNQVVIVNDDSGDDTYSTLSTLNKQWGYPLRLINRSKRLGLASAIFDGLKFSDYDDVIIMDADGQHPPRYLPTLIAELRQHDLVVGTRYFMKDASVPGFSTFRILGSIFCNALAWPLTGLRDSTSGFFGFNKSRAPNLFAYVDPRAFKIGLEYFYRIANKKEVAISFEHRYAGETKMTTSQVHLYLQQLSTAYSREFDIAKFLRFGLVGVSGVFVNLGVLTALVEWFGIQYNLAGVASFIAAVVWNYSWNKIWTFKESNTRWLDGIWKFTAIAVAALLVKQGVMTTFAEVWSFDYRIAAFLGIVVAAVINFYGNKKWTFKETRPTPILLDEAYLYFPRKPLSREAREALERRFQQPTPTEDGG